MVITHATSVMMADRLAENLKNMELPTYRSAAELWTKRRGMMAIRVKKVKMIAGASAGSHKCKYEVLAWRPKKKKKSGRHTDRPENHSPSQ